MARKPGKKQEESTMKKTDLYHVGHTLHETNLSVPAKLLEPKQVFMQQYTR